MPGAIESLRNVDRCSNCSMTCKTRISRVEIAISAYFPVGPRPRGEVRREVTCGAIAKVIVDSTIDKVGCGCEHWQNTAKSKTSHERVRVSW